MITLSVIIAGLAVSDWVFFVSLPLDKMTSLDKIAVMEKLWDDLCRNPESIPSPKWHHEVLEAREKEINEGKAKFTAFDRAKERIRDQIK